MIQTTKQAIKALKEKSIITDDISSWKYQLLSQSDEVVAYFKTDKELINYANEKTNKS